MTDRKYCLELNQLYKQLCTMIQIQIQGVHNSNSFLYLTISSLRLYNSIEGDLQPKNPLQKERKNSVLYIVLNYKPPKETNNYSSKIDLFLPQSLFCVIKHIFFQKIFKYLLFKLTMIDKLWEGEKNLQKENSYFQNVLINGVDLIMMSNCFVHKTSNVTNNNILAFYSNMIEQKIK